MATHQLRRSILCTSLILGILLLALGTFFPLLSAGFLMLDDSYLITENPLVTDPSLSSVLQAFRSYDPELYIPVTLLSYQFDRIIGDFSPLMFHLHNILLHLGCGGLVFWLLLLLTRSRGVAGFIALVFLFHPVQTEAVSWLSARKDLLSSFFLLASLVAYIRHRSLHGVLRRDIYLLSIALFVVALLAKVSVAVLPLLLLVIDEPMSRWDRVPKEHRPFWVFSIVFIVIGIFGKTASFGHLSPGVTMLIGSHSLLSLVLRILVPIDLQPLSILHGWASPSALTFVLAFIALGVLVLTGWMVRRGALLGRLLSSFLIFLLPVGVTFWKDGVVYLPSDRYVYLAIIPLTLCVLCVLQSMTRSIRWMSSLWLRWSFAVVFILLLGVMTHRQTRVWVDDSSLFSYVLALEPRSHVALNNLGNVERSRSHLPSAIDFYTRAINAKPDFAIAYRNAGSAYLASKDLRKAVQYYRHAVMLSPEYSIGYRGLGIALLESKQYRLSAKAFERAIEIDPHDIDAYIGLGSVYYAERNAKKEREVYENGLILNPGDPSLQQNLAVLLREAKK